jgi:hypothetical protein
MSMDDRVAGEPLQFILIDKTPSSDLKLICQAPSDEVKDNWTSQLRSILDMQGNLLRGMNIENLNFCLFRHSYSVVVL